MQKINYKQKFDVIVFINYVLITVEESEKLQFTINYHSYQINCSLGDIKLTRNLLLSNFQPYLRY